MEFTYLAYQNMLHLLKENGYDIVTYGKGLEYKKHAILRHDVDMSLQKAVELATIEYDEGVVSTFFLLITSDFYNIFSIESRKALKRLMSFGHRIGLHFDETSYCIKSSEEMIEKILYEKRLLEQVVEKDVLVVSMHRPSKQTLELDLKIPGMYNSYSKAFFHDYKYVSDSRRKWREPVEQIIVSGEYPRLHILTHAFWYNNADVGIIEAVHQFVNGANQDRYKALNNNLTELSSIMAMQEVR